ncbi:MAG: glycosyltransferase [Dehalococcoidia bacterium]|jgi:glycosyltransferase involved in cell wall biosynthesis
MRLCYLADAPYIHTQRWVRHFVARGDDIDVISFRPAAIEGARVHYVDGWERAGKLRYLIHAPRVSRLVRSLEPDLVHALHLTSYGFLAAFAGVHPLITSVWGTDVLEAPRLTPFHGFITRYALARADRVTATGMRLAEATLPYVPQGKDVAVVPYGVDLDRFSARERAGGESLVVGSVGRLSAEKGLKYLLEAMATFAREEPRARLLLAGDGPERRALERLASRLGLADRMEFVGEVAHEQVPEVLARMDVFAMPSTWEGFGVAALEAEAMEVPVVASNIHGIPDVVDDGVSGILVPPKDIDALSLALVRLLRDGEERRRMGRAGRELVASRYSWTDSTRRMEALYDELLSVPSGRRP